MPDTRKGYKVPATVIAGHESFPVADSNDVAGNIMFFDSPDKLTTIPVAKRKLGMFAYIYNEGRHFKLVNNKAVLDASCWEPYELVSKEYVDNAVANAGGGGGTSTPVDAYTKAESDNKYALKTDIPTVPDISDLETTQHAEDTYAKKTDLEALEGVVPKIINNVFDIPEGSSNDPLVLEFEIPNGTVGINVFAIAEVEKESSGGGE
jgi:hypothetical protein